MSDETTELSISVSSYMAVRTNGQKQSRFHIVIRDNSTGRTESEDCPMDADIMKRRLESLVVRQFSDSKMAKRIREQRGMVPVSIKKGFEESLFTDIHVALRKSCQGPGTALWWNFFQDCSGLLLDELTAMSIRAIKDLEGRQILLSNVGSSLHMAWTKVLGPAVAVTNMIKSDRIREVPHYSDIDADRILEMSVKDVDKFCRDLSTAAMMLDYLTTDDWNSMASTIVDFKE